MNEFINFLKPSSAYIHSNLVLEKNILLITPSLKLQRPSDKLLTTKKLHAAFLSIFRKHLIQSTMMFLWPNLSIMALEALPINGLHHTLKIDLSMFRFLGLILQPSRSFMAFRRVLYWVLFCFLFILMIFIMPLKIARFFILLTTRTFSILGT